MDQFGCNKCWNVGICVKEIIDISNNSGILCVQLVMHVLILGKCMLSEFDVDPFYWVAIVRHCLDWKQLHN